MTRTISLVVLTLAGAALTGCPDNGSKQGTTPGAATATSTAADPAPKAAGSASAKPTEGGGW